jgi:hypothetical protein
MAVGSGGGGGWGTKQGMSRLWNTSEVRSPEVATGFDNGSCGFSPTLSVSSYPGLLPGILS